MKIVIVGDGKVGYNIAKQLLAEGHDIVVIDNNPDVLEDSLQKLDVLVVGRKRSHAQDAGRGRCCKQRSSLSPRPLRMR